MKHLSVLVPDDQTNMSTIACIVGTYQVFTEANHFKIKNGKKAVFDIALVGASTNKTLKNDFVSLQHQVSVAEIDQTHLIIIPASLIRTYKMATPNNKLLIDWISAQYKQGAEIASMCIGSFMLASTGLLKGKTCSTHWALADSFKDL